MIAAAAKATQVCSALSKALVTFATVIAMANRRPATMPNQSPMPRGTGGPQYLGTGLRRYRVCRVLNLVYRY